MTPNLVVVRFVDGRILKGTTRDFLPGRGNFHVEAAGAARPIEVIAKQLKAVYFVKSLEGEASRQNLHGFVQGPPETQQGKKIAVRFADGELLCGYTVAYSPGREGFYVFPADVQGNNQRVFVITAATKEVQTGPAAELLAQRDAGPNTKAG